MDDKEAYQGLNNQELVHIGSQNVLDLLAYIYSQCLDDRLACKRNSCWVGKKVDIDSLYLACKGDQEHFYGRKDTLLNSTFMKSSLRNKRIFFYSKPFKSIEEKNV